MSALHKSKKLRAKPQIKDPAPKSLAELLADDGTYQPLIPSLLLRGFVWVEQCLQDNLKHRGLPQISRMESQVLTMMGGGITRPIEIAKSLSVSRQTLNQNIRLLQNRGLIGLTADPNDGRCKILSFSADGIIMIEAAIEILGHAEDILSKRLGAANLRRLKNTLDTDFGDIPIFDPLT